ncbi:histone H1 [Cynara cardunculus var. scolymus]|uniref:Histone H1/H5 n=1 Tax=Cynara cardunculus var. scolymus TaxID=59895 RepID=A0A124SFE0_CYNCS|nr:histone H1 [Cynara cardunculus var. scolymus]KVI02943.1 Histone H1/H5 [Cynara cardunculus var. scolymus]
MSSTREGENVNDTVEQPATEKPLQAVEKVVKEKKAKAPKEKKSTKSASHPPYFQMIKEALLALNEKGGSSPHAIAKYMEEKHKAVLPENFRKMLAVQLKNSASKGKLTKVKASYKLCESGKKEKAPPAAAGGKKPTIAAKKPKQTKAKKPAATATTGGSNKVAKSPKKSARTATVKKQATVKKAKKMTPAKPKQPKSIKSPAAKKARKATT